MTPSLSLHAAVSGNGKPADQIHICTALKSGKETFMSKVKIVRNVAFIESAVSLADLKNLAKHRPAALILKDEDKNELYKLAIGTGDGSIGKFGAVYGSQADAAKPAAITVHIPDDVKDAKAYVAEVYGGALLKINQIEKQFDAAAKEIEADLAAVNASISVE